MDTFLVILPFLVKIRLGSDWHSMESFQAFILLCNCRIKLIVTLREADFAFSICDLMLGL